MENMESKMKAEEVQKFVDENSGKDIRVTFQRNDGTVAIYSGMIPPDQKRSESIAFITMDGYKRFNINSVISIEEV